MTDNEGLNLTPHRTPVSVWDRRGWDGTPERLAVTRWLVGIGGSMLVGLGGSLAWWALTGEGDLSEPRRRFGQLIERVGGRRDDLVHDASADSFPASDAPSWTPTSGPGLSRRARTP